MVSFQYKERIHKAKFTARSLRYAMSDQAARLFPALQKRWLFPVEGRPIAEAASASLAIPSVIVEAEFPNELDALGLNHSRPLQCIHHVYSLEEVVLTGWAGSMIKDGLLLTIRPRHNWVSGLRAHPYRLRRLSSSRPYLNLMAPIPARGHIFHWLFDSIIPLLSYLESGGAGGQIGLIVNARLSEIQERTIEFVKARYGISHIETLGKSDAVQVPHLKVSIPDSHTHKALQAEAGLACIGDLARFLVQPSARSHPLAARSMANAPRISCTRLNKLLVRLIRGKSYRSLPQMGEDFPRGVLDIGDIGAAGQTSPRRLYISRADARLRRIVNEDEIAPSLERFGFERVTLSGMPIGRQVQLFRGAEAVAGPHGAGLAHIAWCRPGTRILEFFPDPAGPRGHPKNATSDYWRVSRMRGLSYSCRLGGPVLNRHDGFRIPAETLASALQEIGIA